MIDVLDLSVGEPKTVLRRAVSRICHVAKRQTRGRTIHPSGRNGLRAQVALHLTHFHKRHPNIQTPKR